MCHAPDHMDRSTPTSVNFVRVARARNMQAAKSNRSEATRSEAVRSTPPFGLRRRGRSTRRPSLARRGTVLGSRRGSFRRPRRRGPRTCPSARSARRARSWSRARGPPAAHREGLRPWGGSRLRSGDLRPIRIARTDKFGGSARADTYFHG